MKIIACPGAEHFTQEILSNIPGGVSTQVEFTNFKNGEIKCKIEESIRGQDVYIIQDVANTLDVSVNDRLMELFVTIDAVKHASPSYINVIVPTFPYARQHKKQGREGLTAAWVAQSIERMRVGRVITLDIHSTEICNAFHHTVLENLHPSYQIIKKIIKILDKENIVVVAPDTGAANRARFFAECLECDLAMIYKERDYSKVTKSANDSNIKSVQLLGNCKNKDCVIIDDMIDTGGSLLKAAAHLKCNEAKRIVAAVSLPFFNGSAIDDFEKAVDCGEIYKVISTDAVYNPKLWNQKWFIKADISKFFAEVIVRLSTRQSISELLDSRRVIQELMLDN